ncbi:hypothetical protein MIR68_011500 [Amoeboaphelidium protococcarum]|nr:hypothetical protein MIR68_011500 [Amoeboaphelidium protococcarum]
MIQSPIKVSIVDESIESLNGLTLSELLDLFPLAPTHDPAETAQNMSPNETLKGQFSSLLRGGNKNQSTATLQRDTRKTGALGGGNLSNLQINTAGGSSMLSPVSKGNLVKSVSTVGSAAIGGSALSVDTRSDSVQQEDYLNYQLPSGLPDKDYVDLLRRALKNIIAPKDLDQMNKFLVALPPSKCLGFQKAVQDSLSERSASSSPTKGRSSFASFTDSLKSLPADVQLNKCNLDFGLKGRALKLGEQCTDTITVSLVQGKQCKLAVKMPDTHPAVSLKVDQQLVKLKSKEKVEFNFTIAVKRPIIVSEVIQLDVEGGNKWFITVNITSEWSNFGASLSDSKMEKVEHGIFSDRKYTVPKALVKLRNLLKDCNGFTTEEIFRKQIDEEKMMVARSHFDQHSALNDLTAESVSNLIKIFVRELPERPIDLAVEQVLTGNTTQLRDQLMQDKAKADKQVLLWIIDLMCEVLKSSDANRMSSKKLAIVMAPNLFPLNAGVTNAEYLRKSAELVTFLFDERFKTLN